MGHNYRSMHFFCEELSLSAFTHAFRRGAADMLVFSFAVRRTPNNSMRFGGELTDSAASIATSD
jgi:hypothetical protein